MTLEIALTVDFVCPWCFIGQRRLLRAIAQLRTERDDPMPVKMTYRPYELNPIMPADGMDRATYRAAKFGNAPGARLADAQTTAIGKSLDIDFAYGRITRMPSTHAAHRLMGLAAADGDPSLLAEKLFLAYFTEGRDLSDRAVLRDVGRASGLPKDKIDTLLSGDDGTTEIRASQNEAYARGVTSIPSFEIGLAMVTGAQSIEVLGEVLRAALEHRIDPPITAHSAP